MKALQGPSRIMATDEILTVRHYLEVVYANGKPLPVAFEDIEIRANVQPVTGLQLMIVPEADRFKEQYYVYSQDKSKISINDKVIRLGVNFQVQNVEEWGSYQRAMIMRVDVGPDSRTDVDPQSQDNGEPNVSTAAD